MPRVTIDLDAGVLSELEERRRVTGRSVSQIVSELLGHALQQTTVRTPRQPLRWRSAPMGAKVDLDDNEGLRRAR